MKQDLAKEITTKVAQSFRCFGGGRGSSWNPITEVLKDQPPQFVAGVDVEEVVRFVLHEQEWAARRKRRRAVS